MNPSTTDRTRTHRSTCPKATTCGANKDPAWRHLPPTCVWQLAARPSGCPTGSTYALGQACRKRRDHVAATCTSDDRTLRKAQQRSATSEMRPLAPRPVAGHQEGARANPGAGTCTFSGHRHLSATNAPGRRHVATPRAHCTKVTSCIGVILAAGSQPNMGRLAARRPNHVSPPYACICLAQAIRRRPAPGSSCPAVCAPHPTLISITNITGIEPPLLTGRARYPPHPARRRRPRPAPAADCRAFQAKPGRGPAAGSDRSDRSDVQCHKLPVPLARAARIRP